MLQKVKEFILSHKNSKAINLFVLLLLIAAVPLTVFVAQQRQETRQRASANTAACINKNVPVSVPVLAMAYFPPDPNRPDYLNQEETDWGGNNWGQLKIKDWEQRTQQQIDTAIPYINEATKYHGYKDPNAVSSLNYSILDYKKFYEPMPRGDFASGTTYRVNYGKILRDQNICDYVDNRGVKEVWIYGYHSSKIVPDESRMSSKYGDISNSLPKEEFVPQEFRMPVCQNSYVFYNFTYQPSGGIENNIHNRIHQIENEMGYSDRNTFWFNFSEYGPEYPPDRNTWRSSCGNSHIVPNWTEHQTQGYIYNLTNNREFNCETWDPDDSKTTYMNANCERWGCTELGFYKWFMQNMPGYNNGIVYQGQKMRNWWEAMYDFNAFIDKGRSLYGESIFECSQPTSSPTAISPPTSTPTPTPFVCTACAADIDKSGRVDDMDYQRFIACLGKKSTEKDWYGRSCAPSDIDKNGIVGTADYNCLIQKFYQTCSSTFLTPTPFIFPTPTNITPFPTKVLLK